MSYFSFFLYRLRRPPASSDASGLPPFPKEHGYGSLMYSLPKRCIAPYYFTPHKQTPPKQHKNCSPHYCFVYPLFSFIFLIFLSIFIHFYLFFHIFLFYTSRVASIFTSFFCFCGRDSGGVWPTGGTWARQRGVWPANCMHSVGSERAEAVQGQRPFTAQFGCSH